MATLKPSTSTTVRIYRMWMPRMPPRTIVLTALTLLLLFVSAAAGIAAYAIYDQRHEIHTLQARLTTVGQRSERTAQATRALCSALLNLQEKSAPGLVSLARLTRSDCAPLLRLPTER